MTAELAVNKIKTQIIVGNNQKSLYFHNNHNHMHYILSGAILLGSIFTEFIIYQNSVSGTEITDNFYVMD